eukprot:CAMPEP_0178897408 /NCGR_PEP_ID=MMETSP0786-20121207/1727_1 /TAXON_ID=186022 /ORGANISM="Thalassionema frauenfeldii, Strain CCMP 1798" /LENGTH=220 /DNA_ID=CAMNT_0020567949 /DNA_START=39 /DNA_END=701 /DNA_ORIENTATION=-
MNDTTPSPNPVNDTCFDTPDWQTESYRGGMVGCDSFEVNCIGSGTPAIENCCKCKKECCGKCEPGQWDLFTCDFPTQVPAPTRAPTDETVCPCSRRVQRRGIGGGYVSVNEKYTKTCPLELVPNWPDDCQACCSYVSPEQSTAIFGLLGLLALIPIGMGAYFCYKKRKENNIKGPTESEIFDTPAATTIPTGNAKEEPVEPEYTIGKEDSEDPATKPAPK